MARVLNSLGIAQWYGPRTGSEGLPSGILEDGPKRRLVIDFDYLQANDGLPTVNGEDDAAQLVIPDGALIESAVLFVVDAFTSAGAATLELGTELADGTVVDADGLDSIAVASLTAGSVHVLDGAQIGTNITTDHAQISVNDGTAVFTAGSARLMVTYIPFQV